MYTNQSSETEFPVLQMDWVESMTLDNYLPNNINVTYRLSLVAYQFCHMASWLLCQDFTHSNLDPNNIIVCDESQLVLIDYDDIYPYSISFLTRVIKNYFKTIYRAILFSIPEHNNS